MSWCLNVFHTWVPVGVMHYNDTSFGFEMPSTAVTLMCSKCNDIKTKNLYCSGHLTLEQLKTNGVPK